MADNEQQQKTVAAPDEGVAPSSSSTYVIRGDDGTGCSHQGLFYGPSWGVCPSCGRCRACGREAAPAWPVPYYPWGLMPWWPTYPVITTTGGSTGTGGV